jgi:hypothetical protein
MSILIVSFQSGFFLYFFDWDTDWTAKPIMMVVGSNDVFSRKKVPSGVTWSRDPNCGCGAPKTSWFGPLFDKTWLAFKIVLKLTYNRDQSSNFIIESSNDVIFGQVKGHSKCSPQLSIGGAQAPKTLTKWVSKVQQENPELAKNQRSPIHTILKARDRFWHSGTGSGVKSYKNPMKIRILVPTMRLSAPFEPVEGWQGSKLLQRNQTSWKSKKRSRKV